MDVDILIYFNVMVLLLFHNLTGQSFQLIFHVHDLIAFQGEVFFQLINNDLHVLNTVLEISILLFDLIGIVLCQNQFIVKLFLGSLQFPDHVVVFFVCDGSVLLQRCQFIF